MEGGRGGGRGGETMEGKDGRQFRHSATPKEAVLTQRLAVLECTHISENFGGMSITRSRVHEYGVLHPAFSLPSSRLPLPLHLGWPGLSVYPLASVLLIGRHTLNLHTKTFPH